MAKKPYNVGRRCKATGTPPATAIKAMLKDSFAGLLPREINSGNCDSFADELNALIGGQILLVTQDHDLPPHSWVELNGYHYDAEVPEGVSEWKELPIFQRQLA